jgi:hypothetical protein
MDDLATILLTTVNLDGGGDGRFKRKGILIICVSGVVLPLSRKKETSLADITTS